RRRRCDLDLALPENRGRGVASFCSLSLQKCAIEEADDSSFVLLWPCVDPADMPTARHLPDHLWLTGGRVVGRVEVSLPLLSMLPVDEEHRRRSDAADEVLEARRRRVVREERDPRAERGVRGNVGPLAVSRDVEVFADRTFAGALGYNGFESASSRGRFEHHLAADREPDPADP